jgi:hypothetical protein
MGLPIGNDIRNPNHVSLQRRTGKGISMAWSPDNAVTNGNSPSATLSSFLVRYRMPLYLVLAAATSLSVVWNWNWLTGAEVFRIMAALPCTFMMLMCMRRASCR